MKPVQTHRIIKDKISLSNDKLLPANNGFLISNAGANGGYNDGSIIKKSNLAPINNGRESFISRQEEIAQIKGGSMFAMGLPKIDNGNSSNRDQIINMEKRIKDLEKENYRLSHHVQQAEQTLRNYREVFGALPAELPKNDKSINIAPKAPVHVATVVNKENATPSVTNNHELQQLQAQIVCFEAKLRESQQRTQDISSERDKVSNQLRELQAQFNQQLDTIKQYHRTNEKNDQTIQSLHQTISQQKEELIHLKMKVGSSSSSSSEEQQKKKKLQQIVRQLSLLLQQTRDEYKQLKAHTKDEIQSLQSQTNRQIEDLQNYFSLLLNNSLQYLQAHRAEFALFKNEHDQIVLRFQERIHQLESSPKKGTGQTSPKKAELLSPIKSAAALMELENLQRMNKEFSSRLETTTNALASLSDLHKAEIKSIKHLAHIRELIRVAKEREQAIDKDRMIIEIKHLK